MQDDFDDGHGLHDDELTGAGELGDLEHGGDLEPDLAAMVAPTGRSGGAARARSATPSPSRAPRKAAAKPAAKKAGAKKAAARKGAARKAAGRRGKPARKSAAKGRRTLRRSKSKSGKKR